MSAHSLFMASHPQNNAGGDEDDQYYFVPSVAPSNAATDSNNSDLSDIPPAAGMAAALVVPDTTDKGQKRGGKSVAFAKDVSPGGPSHQQLTEKDLQVHNLMVQRGDRHNEDLMGRFLVGQGRDPAATEPWAMPPHPIISSVRPEYGASSRSRATQDSTGSFVFVDHPSEEDNDIAAAGIWADVPTTYYPEVVLL